MKILTINNTKVAYHFLPSKLTNIQILTNVGSISEEKDIWGMAHILEHMTFKGSKNFPGPLAIQTAANDIGGKLNAWTSLDCTCYYISVLNDFFKQGFTILADMYQNPLYPEEEFVKELNPILSEMRRYEDNPDSYLANRLMPAMIGEKAGHPVIGTEESVCSANVSKMHTFRERFYGGSNILLSIVGGISEDEVVRVVSALFMPLKDVEAPIVPVVKYESGDMSLKKAGITEAVYSLCYPALPRFHADRYKQSLMTYVLGGNDSGMLHERIREEAGMSCYGIYASQSHFDSHSILEISTGIAPEELDRCHDEVLGQIKRISTDLIDDTRLARAKASLRTSIAHTTESSVGYNNLMAIPFLKGQTHDPLEKLLSEIEATTKEDILTLAQQTFVAEPFKGTLLPEA